LNRELIASLDTEKVNKQHQENKPMFTASSEYIAKQVDGTLLTIQINVGLPELDPLSSNGDYRCKVEIQALSFSEYSYGVDAVQSLCLVVQCLNYVLKPLISAGWSFYLPQDLQNELDIMAALFPPQT
jgi:hypothetical protein